MRRILFFFLSIVFLVIIAEVLLFSPRDVKNVERESILNEPTEVVERVADEAAQLLTDLELMEAGDGGKEWTLRSKEAALYEDTNEWRIKGVEVKLFGGDGTEYFVTGDSGRVAIETKDIWVSGNVKIKSDNGYLIETSEVQYIGKDRRLVSSEKILMLGPKEDGKPSIQVSGTGLSAELATNRIYLLTNVRANKPMREEKLMAIQSESAEFSGNNQLAKFIRSVIIDYGGTRITGPYAEFQYGESQMKSMNVTGGIRVTDVEKWATANEIEMLFKEEKYILKGAPKVVQNNDELVGNEIVFLQGGKEIQVKGAKAKFENEKVQSLE